MDRLIDCKFNRRFGAELELNTANGIVVELDENDGETPNGIENVAATIHKALNKTVIINKWQNTNNNSHWVTKPDSSCGIEVCSPILSGRRGLYSLLKVSDALAKAKFSADHRCSFHIHVNIADLSMDELAKIIVYYIKCESVIFDSFPISRKNNRYCMCIGATNMFRVNDPMDPEDIIKKVSASKYHSINAFRFMKGGGFMAGNMEKRTLEFRIAESAACLDPVFIKNWVNFVLHFVETTRNLPWPEKYNGKPETGLAWLDPENVFSLLKFDQPGTRDMVEMRTWLINRILQNGFADEAVSLWSSEARSVARNEINRYIKKHRLAI